VDPISSFVISEVATALIAELVGRAIDLTQTKLKRDETQKALQIAITAAVQQYTASASYRLVLARPLVERDSPLTLPPVVEEITQIVRFEREPNYELVGRYWREAIAEPPSWRDFSEEAKFLLALLHSELKESPTFRPVFIQKTLDAIADDVSDMAEHTAQLVELTKLVSSKLTTVAAHFENTSRDVHLDILDFGFYMNNRTQGFVGREFAFKKVEAFINKRQSGYFLLLGQPGMGKTALAAQFVKLHGCVHHFNQRAIGLTTADAFLRNVCAQLIAAYNVEGSVPGERETRTGADLVAILDKVSARRNPEDKIAIVVDALDETDEMRIGANMLYLPNELPKGVYIIVTMRENAPGKLPALDAKEGSLVLAPQSQENIADIRQYLSTWVPRKGIQAYLRLHNLDEAAFIGTIEERSQYNFMYLHHVLPAIERGDHTDRDLATLPLGLERYYEEHWELMRGKDDEAWFKYKLPILWALAIKNQPLPVESIAKFSGAGDINRVVTMLQPRAWGQFLNIEKDTVDGETVKLYSLYHATFQEFLRQKDELAGFSMSREAKRRFVEAADKDLGLWEA
jgi:hypothetical protein